MFHRIVNSSTCDCNCRVLLCRTRYVPIIIELWFFCTMIVHRMLILLYYFNNNFALLLIFLSFLHVLKLAHTYAWHPSNSIQVNNSTYTRTQLMISIVVISSISIVIWSWLTHFLRTYLLDCYTIGIGVHDWAGVDILQLTLGRSECDCTIGSKCQFHSEWGKFSVWHWCALGVRRIWFSSMNWGWRYVYMWAGRSEAAQ